MQVWSVAADLRHAWRALCRTPVFALSIVLSLAIAVALNGVVFAFVDAALFRPPPFFEADRLITIQDSRRVPGNYLLTRAEANDFRSTATGIEEFGAYRAGFANRFGLALDESPSTHGIAVSASIFTLLRAKPFLGRTIQESDDRLDAVPVVLLGFNLWQRVFGSDTAVLGRPIGIGGRQFIAVGVMPRAFWFPGWDFEFWTPLASALGGSGADRSLSLIARIRPETNHAAAVAELEGIGKQLDGMNGKKDRRWWRVDRLEEVLRPGDLKLLIVLQAAAACILLLGCVNAANLIAARISSRGKDFAVRRALGATGLQAVKPVVWEGLLLGAATGIVGATMSLTAIKIITANLSRSGMAAWVGGGPTHVAAFAIASGGLATALCLAAPIFNVVSAGTDRTLVAESYGAISGRNASRMSRGATVVQVALSLALCANTLQLAASLRRAAQWSPSFPVDNLISFRVMRRDRLMEDRALTHELLEQVRAIDGVNQATLSRMFIPDGSLTTESGTVVNTCSCQWVSPDFLETLQVPLYAGRGFLPGDDGVAIVDPQFARQLWQDEDPIMRRIQVGDGGRWYTVVGVAPPIELSRPSPDSRLQTPPTLLLASLDSAQSGMIFVRVSPQVSMVAVADSIRAVARALGTPRTAGTVRLVARAIQESLGPLRSYAGTYALLSMMGLFLTMVGINGIFRQYVTLRLREISVRAALGATPSVLFLSVARGAARLATIGTFLGVALAYVSARIVSTVAADMGTVSAIEIVGAAAVVFLACILVTVPPALRAGTVSPIVSLR